MSTAFAASSIHGGHLSCQPLATGGARHLSGTAKLHHAILVRDQAGDGEGGSDLELCRRSRLRRDTRDRRWQLAEGQIERLTASANRLAGNPSVIGGRVWKPMKLRDPEGHGRRAARLGA